VSDNNITQPHGGLGGGSTMKKLIDLTWYQAHEAWCQEHEEEIKALRRAEEMSGRDHYGSRYKLSSKAIGRMAKWIKEKRKVRP